MLMAIEVKASERAGGRLSRAEVLRDIQKLSAHRHEVRRLGADMTPVMMVIDVAPLPSERMRAEDVRWLYRRTGIDFRRKQLPVRMGAESAGQRPRRPNG